MRKLKSILMSLVLCLAFSTASFSNVNLENNCKENTINPINYESSILTTDLEFNSNILLIKDGKFWQAVKDFFTGVLDGYSGEPMPMINGGNNSGENEEQLIKNINEFAQNNIRNKDNAFMLFYKMQKLIESDKELVSKNDILEILNPKGSNKNHPEWLKELIDDIFKGGKTNPNSTIKENIDKKTKSYKLDKRDIKSKKISKIKPNNNDEVMPKLKIN